LMSTMPDTRFRIHVPGAATRLTSWKEIAAYLDRDPRTVQLWEKAEGLPVHRLNHQARASVYAFTHEVDAWLSARSLGTIRPGPQVVKQPLHRNAASGVKVYLHLGSRTIIALAALLLTVAALTAWFAVHRISFLQPSTPVLAVLPFQNQASTSDAFANSLSAGLIADLARVQSLKIIARPSIAHINSGNISLEQIAGRLHASLALIGGIAQSGNNIQVTVELLDLRRNSHLWGATYTRSTGNTVALEEEIASQIAADVARKISGSTTQVSLRSAVLQSSRPLASPQIPLRPSQDLAQALH
jgi:TolB-like protein